MPQQTGTRSAGTECRPDLCFQVPEPSPARSSHFRDTRARPASASISEMPCNAKVALFLAVVAACAPGVAATDGDQVAPFFGFMGAMSALVFANMGAAYGTAKSGVGIASMGVMRPELVMKSIVPVVMAGVLGIYGLIIAVIISTNSASATRSRARLRRPSFSPRRRTLPQPRPLF